MYLTRIILNPSARQVQRELAEPYEMHRTLGNCFTHIPFDERGRSLFRVDIHPRTGVPTVLLQSPYAPQWDWLHDKPGAHNYLLPNCDGNPATKVMDYQLHTGQVLAFRLRANPSVKRTREGKDGTVRKVRDGLLREEEQRTWLERKADQGGFRVSNVIVFQEGNVHGRIYRDGGERHRLSLLSVRFEGLLHVNDPQLVWQSVVQGIGSGKSLGFGLLSLAPPRG